MIKPIRKKLFLTLLVSISLLSSCKKDDTPDPENTSINRIMPLGASRVEGARPGYESFRYELWKDLNENNWTFDFIGTQTDDASYPRFEGLSFDNDHEGRGGWTSGEISAGLSSWLAITGSPDIVLLSSPGGNDALQNLPFDQAVANIKKIIDVLQNNNPKVTIVIEQLAPGKSDFMTEDLQIFFNEMQKEVLNIAEQKTTSDSEIVLVNMFSGFDDDMLADDVHYNELGATFIAEQYYEVLEDILKR